MELYKRYLKERENIECEYTANCFITYKNYDDNTVAIIDIFSTPEVRSKGETKEFVEALLGRFKEEGKETVFGFTDERTNGWKRSEELMKKFGFRYTGKDPDNKNINNYYMDL